MAIRVSRAPGPPCTDGAVISSIPQKIAHKGNGEGLGFVSKDYGDLFRQLSGPFANREPVATKPPHRIIRASADDVRGGFDPYGVLTIKTRFRGEQLPLQDIVTGEYMKWAIVESLSETFTRSCKTRVKPNNILFCSDGIEVLDLQMPYLGDCLWQFCEFRFDYRIRTQNVQEASKLVKIAFSRMTDFEENFCKNLELKFREMYHLTVLGLLNKRYTLVDGQRSSDELNLFLVAQANDLAQIDELLMNGTNVNATHKANSFPKMLLDESTRFVFLDLSRSALLAAAEEGNVEAMRTLLDARADMNYKDASGFHALYLAAGAPQRAEECVVFLLSRKANVEMTNNCGYTPLHNACGSGQVRSLFALLDAGADLNAKSRNGAAPIHVAVINDQPDILEAISSRKADLDMPTFEGNTPVHEGVLSNNPGIIKKLMELRADINLESGPGHEFATPLKMAIQRKKKKSAKMLRALGALEMVADAVKD